MLEALAASWVFMAGLMGLLWFRQCQTLNATAVDVGWSLGFSATALIGTFFFFRPEFSVHIAIVASLVLIWSLRLGLTLFFARVYKKNTEDSRYRRLRSEAGWSQKAFFVMYQFQALLVVVLTVAIYTAMSAPSSTLVWTDLIGIAIALLAISGETLADRQLKRFLADPANRGRTCQVGLWRYSRHPNYFFEWLYWWSFVCLALTSSTWWLALLGPAVMLWFLLKITGVPAAERSSLKSRPDYADYQRRTSAFVPWFPKA